jgi:hypothetical protein
MLPSNESSFHLKVVGNRTKNTYEGDFVVKTYLTNSELIDVGLRLDTYNRGSQTVNQGVTLLNRAIAELEVRILKAPSWWKDSDHGRNLFDTNILLELFNKVMDAEASYGEKIEEVAKAAEKSIESSGSKKKSKEA